MTKLKKMDNTKLFEILSLVKWVKCTRWNDVMKIVENMALIEVVEKKWFVKYKADNPEWYPLDLSQLKTWSTYEHECINLSFSNINNKLCCNVNIYEGDNLTGHRKELRFTAKLIMPSSYIEELSEKILNALDRVAEDSYYHHLENQKKLWMANFKDQILYPNKPKFQSGKDAIIKSLPQLEKGMILEYQDLTGLWYEYTKDLQKNIHFQPINTRVRSIDNL